MTKKYLNSKDTEKEFYFYLGLLATLFSKMESNLLDILGKLIVDDFVLTNTILEKNSLAQNIELLKSINRYRGFQEKYFESLISKMGSVRKNRNLFIHGVWSEPQRKENDLVITCIEPKLSIEQQKSGRKIWGKVTHHEFRLSYIRKQVEQVEDVIYIQDKLLELLEDYDYQ